MNIYIFDLDGTIADSNGVWDKIDRQIITESGKKIPEDVISSLAAMGYEELYNTLNTYGIIFENISSLRKKIDDIAEYEYANTISIKDGAGEYIRYISADHRTVLFTDSPERFYRPFLDRFGLTGCFSDLICSEDICAVKKQQSGYVKLAEKLGVMPSECIVFEDSPKCAVSASLAGMKVIGVYDRFSAFSEGYESLKKYSFRYINNFNELMGCRI